MKCCSNKIAILEEKPCWLRSIPVIQADNFEEAMLFHQLKEEWIQHVKEKSHLYSELILQKGSYQRYPFVVYDRKRIEFKSTIPRMAMTMKTPLIKRVVLPPIMEVVSISIHPYPEEDQHHLNTLSNCSQKLYMLLIAMDQYFPFACRYYGVINPYAKWGSEQPFINPMEHEIQDIRLWIEKIETIIKGASLKQYEKNSRLEYTMWFVNNHLLKTKETSFYEPKQVIYNAILLYTYLEETIYEHIQRLSVML